MTNEKQEDNNSHNNDNQIERRNVIDYADRHRNFEWRSQWFTLTRPPEDETLLEIRANALDHKAKLIDWQRESAEHVAAYGPAPASAGTPWFSVGPRNINGRVKSIDVHPTDEDIVYAGAASGGVWKTEDGGESWGSLWNDQKSLSIGSIAIASSNPDTVYVGTGEAVTASFAGRARIHNFPGAGVFVTSDGGTTWMQHTGLINRRITRVVVSPTDDQRVYVGGQSGLERSTDGGSNWTMRSGTNGLPTGQVSDTVIDPASADTLYCAVHNEGIYKSTDGGDNWSQLSNGPTGSTADWIKLDIVDSGANGNDFLIAKTGPGKLHITTDGGSSWTQLSGTHGAGFAGLGWSDMIAVAPDDDDVLIAGGAGNNAERTSDGGSSWSGLSGLHADHHQTIFAPSNTDIVYECNDGGVFKSTDKGATWEKASHGLVISQFYDVGSWDPISTVLGGGLQDQGTIMTTGGLTWSKILGADGGYFVIDPRDPRTIYAEYQSTAIKKSTDGGNTWTSKTGGLSGANPWTGVLEMDPNDPDTLFTGTTKVYRTTDGISTNWNASSQTLAAKVSTIVVAQSDSDRVYAGTGDTFKRSGQGKIYRSDDNGATSPWDDKTTSELPSSRPLMDIAVDISDKNRVVVCYGGTSSGSSANHVFESTNGGDNWDDINGNNLPNVSVNAVALDPNDNNTIYVGTDAGVFRTTDGGTNWQAFDNGIPNVVISDLHVDDDEEMMYAATFGRGMYKLDISSGASEPQVDLYLRDSLLDTGERTPSPSGRPNPNDVSDQVYWWESPDIKTEVSPFFDDAGAVFDGVEFDAELSHEDPQRTRTNRVYLQVHNRGWQESSNVNVRVFFADASAGLPSLPNALSPPDFNLTSTADWQPIGPVKTISNLEPNRPEVVSWDWTVPASAATHSCLLAVISSGDDPITTTETNVDQLVKNEKRVCLKNLHVVNSSGPRPVQTLLPINFHNVRDHADSLDIVIDPAEFGGGTLGLLLEPVEFTDELENVLLGVERYNVREGEDVGDWYLPPGAEKDNKSRELRRELWDQLDTTTIYELDPAKRSELRGIRIGEGQTLRGVITTKGGHNVPYGQTQQFSIQQRQDGEIVGGSTYEIRLKRARDLHPVSRIRMILEKVQILDDQEHWFRGKGEFVFSTSVIFNGEDCRRHIRRLPEKGQFKIDDTPGKNVLELDICIFDGYVAEADRMDISVQPVEEDWPDPNEELTLYSRRFQSPPETWVGSYGPDDEPQNADKESAADWRLWYRIESVDL